MYMWAPYVNEMKGRNMQRKNSCDHIGERRHKGIMETRD